MSQGEERESIWSVHRRVKTLYFFLFTLILIIEAIVIWINGVRTGSAFLTSLSPLVIGAAALTLVLAEGGSAIMVWVEKLIASRDQARAEAAAAKARVVEAEAKARAAVSHAAAAEAKAKAATAALEESFIPD